MALEWMFPTPFYIYIQMDVNLFHKKIAMLSCEAYAKVLKAHYKGSVNRTFIHHIRRFYLLYITEEAFRCIIKIKIKDKHNCRQYY